MEDKIGKHLMPAKRRNTQFYTVNTRTSLVISRRQPLASGRWHSPKGNAINDGFERRFRVYGAAFWKWQRTKLTLPNGELDSDQRIHDTKIPYH